MTRERLVGAALLLVLVYVVAEPLCGCSPYAAAWRATYAVREAGTLADRTIAGVVLEKHRACQAGPPAQYAMCMEAHRRALDSWRTIARPALDSALVATVAALSIAERVKASKPPDWVAILKPGVCALARLLAAWGYLLPPSVVTALRVPIAVVTGATCPKEASP